MEDRPEILIIRRRAGLDIETPKGGVWKIAFADFMTAMMAFFLVMWLINATDESTKVQVANYFNPVKLAEMSVQRKGLQDPNLAPPSTDGVPDAAAASPPKAPDQQGGDAEPQAHVKFSEEALFRDPYAVLAELAAQSNSAEAGPSRGSGSGGSGEAYRDPFDPVEWHAGSDPVPEPKSEIMPDIQVRQDPAAIAEKPAQAISDPVQTEANQAGAALGQSSEGRIPPATLRQQGAAPVGEPANTDPNLEAEAAQLETEIANALAPEAAASAGPDIAVQGTQEGVLISLTDDVAFGMFAIGSAEPQPEMIAIMEKIASVLKGRPGDLVIRGHTDGRPFKSETYDNWRLSTARAHMAYYMLVRGGLDEKRVERIEGYADRDLRIPEDPGAAANRRIDILVRGAAS